MLVAALSALALASPAPTVSAPVEAASVSAPGSAEAPNGLYPLWEGTGRVLGHLRGTLGLTHAQIGLLDRVQIGVRPSALALRTPNLSVKVALYADERWALATELTGLLVLPGAGEAFFSDQLATPLPSHAALLAVPLNVAGSWRALPWLSLHATATAMMIKGDGAVASGTSTGGFLTAELMPGGGHGLYLHGGQLGLASPALAVLGGSYRYAWSWGEARLGYAYRFSGSGVQSGPLATFGVLL